MGVIRIELSGSFVDGPRIAKEFSALDGGHADAVSQAMEYLSAALPEAIRRDHELHEARKYPAIGYGRGREGR